MATITIKLAPSDVLRDFITYGKKADLMVGAKLEAGKYTIMPLLPYRPITLEPSLII